MCEHHFFVCFAYTVRVISYANVKAAITKTPNRAVGSQLGIEYVMGGVLPSEKAMKVWAL